MFTAHNTQSANAWAAEAGGMPLDVNMKAVGWSVESTFGRFCKKTAATVNMNQALMDSFVKRN